MGDYESSKSIFFLEHQSTSFNGWIGNRTEMSNGCKVILTLNNVAQEKILWCIRHKCSIFFFQKTFCMSKNKLFRMLIPMSMSIQMLMRICRWQDFQIAGIYGLLYIFLLLGIKNGITRFTKYFFNYRPWK